MSTKLLERAAMKAVATETDQRTIEFYALAFSDVPDKQGDIIAPTAVEDWLQRFYSAKTPLPISFAHAAIRNSSDPFAIIGYAPADPEHVFKDQHGLRVRAILDTETNETAQQVWLLAKRGVIKDASVFFMFSPSGMSQLPDGSTLITKIDDIMEAGPCLDGAEDGAYILSVKTAESDAVLMELRAKAVDETTWDGNRAMGMCNSAADYRSICAAEHTIGEPDQRQHWALPHHYLGRGPNADGVRAALSRVPQTQNITDEQRSRAQSHLEAHMREINPDAAKTAEPEGLVTLTLAEYERMKVGATFSGVNKDTIRSAAFALLQMIGDPLAEVRSGEEAAKDNADEPDGANAEDPSVAELREFIATAEQ